MSLDTPKQGTLPRNDDGTLPAYAWPGGYPILYSFADGAACCPPCANGENGSEAHEASADGDSQWTLVAGDIFYEGPPEFCAHCNGAIESAYGDPEEADAPGP